MGLPFVCKMSVHPALTCSLLFVSQAQTLCGLLTQARPAAVALGGGLAASDSSGLPSTWGRSCPGERGANAGRRPCLRGVTGQRRPSLVARPSRQAACGGFSPHFSPHPPLTPGGARCPRSACGGGRRSAVSWPSIRSHAMCCFVNALFSLRQKHGCQSPPQGSAGTGTEQQPHAGSWGQPSRLRGH